MRRAARLDAEPGSEPGSGNQRSLSGNAVTPWAKIETADAGEGGPNHHLRFPRCHFACSGDDRGVLDRADPPDSEPRHEEALPRRNR